MIIPPPAGLKDTRPSLVEFIRHQYASATSESTNRLDFPMDPDLSNNNAILFQPDLFSALLYTDVWNHSLEFSESC